MIYLVSKQRTLFEASSYKYLSIEDSLQYIKNWKCIQFDVETKGLDCHIGTLLMVQFGNPEGTIQIVVDCTTIDITLYKEVLEEKLLIGHNLKFDIQWLYNKYIIPLKVFDTMIAEQLLYLGYPQEFKNPLIGINYSLQKVLERWLGITIDKSVRSTIASQGITEDTIIYAAKDVEHLYALMMKQLTELRNRQCIRAVELECAFVPVCAYMEWCGIHLDENAWKHKMEIDKLNLEQSLKDLNDYVCNNPKLKEFTYINYQMDLFTGFDLTPKCTINWASARQVVPLLKKLGFDTTVKDKKTGESKDSSMEKVLKKQKGIDDEFLKLYLGKGREEDDDYYAGYNGSAKVVTSFGQNHLNAINPLTGRIHTHYNQLGADTGRMSCGSSQNNEDLARLRGLPIKPSNIEKKEGKACPYPNMQQLPSNKVTRNCFTAQEGNLWCSCDYSAKSNCIH